MVGERRGERNLLLRGGPSSGNVGCPKLLDETPGKQVDRCRTVGFAGFNDLNQS